MNNYKDYLKTFHWMKTKTRVYRKWHRCFFCGDTHSLNIHHTTYTNKKGESVLFKEDDHTLLVLCNPCHKCWHSLAKERKYKIDFYKEVRRLFKINNSLKESFKLTRKKLNSLQINPPKPKKEKIMPEITYLLRKVNGKWEYVDMEGNIM